MYNDTSTDFNHLEYFTGETESIESTTQIYSNINSTVYSDEITFTTEFPHYNTDHVSVTDLSSDFPSLVNDEDNFDLDGTQSALFSSLSTSDSVTIGVSEETFTSYASEDLDTSEAPISTSLSTNEETISSIQENEPNLTIVMNFEPSTSKSYDSLTQSELLTTELYKNTTDLEQTTSYVAETRPISSTESFDVKSELNSNRVTTPYDPIVSWLTTENNTRYFSTSNEPNFLTVTEKTTTETIAVSIDNTENASEKPFVASTNMPFRKTTLKASTITNLATNSTFSEFYQNDSTSNFIETLTSKEDLSTSYNFRLDSSSEATSKTDLSTAKFSTLINEDKAVSPNIKTVKHSANYPINSVDTKTPVINYTNKPFTRKSTNTDSTKMNSLGLSTFETTQLETAIPTDASINNTTPIIFFPSFYITRAMLTGTTTVTPKITKAASTETVSTVPSETINTFSSVRSNIPSSSTISLETLTAIPDISEKTTESVSTERIDSFTSEMINITPSEKISTLSSETFKGSVSSEAIPQIIKTTTAVTPKKLSTITSESTNTLPSFPYITNEAISTSAEIMSTTPNWYRTKSTSKETNSLPTPMFRTTSKAAATVSPEIISTSDTSSIINQTTSEMISSVPSKIISTISTEVITETPADVNDIRKTTPTDSIVSSEVSHTDETTNTIKSTTPYQTINSLSSETDATHFISRVSSILSSTANIKDENNNEIPTQSKSEITPEYRETNALELDKTTQFLSKPTLVTKLFTSTKASFNSPSTKSFTIKSISSLFTKETTIRSIATKIIDTTESLKQSTTETTTRKIENIISSTSKLPKNPSTETTTFKIWKHSLTVPSKDEIRTSNTPYLLETSSVTSVPYVEIPMWFRIDADFKEVVGNREEELKKSFKSQLSKIMRLPPTSIQNLTLSEGSIEVSFQLVPSKGNGYTVDEEVLRAASEDLKRLINSNQLKLKDLDGKTLIVVAQNPITTPSPVAPPDNTATILGIVLAIVLLIAIITFTAIMTKYRGTQKLSPLEDTKNPIPSYRKIPYENLLWAISTSKSNQPTGKFDYDSGLWIGPGSPPVFHAPEIAKYNPPSKAEIRKSIRPSTSVRRKLKEDWHIDDRTLFCGR
ncbi:probable GPI-anchored adhesin-like protein PGA55 [Centruroides sculpturatus]|uniref:probable GPI-anchored adhesin-like protein PGA55 n=1 Tax=Centruroides sculpturatus TaxID=218467 RepID=UPI000C6E667A|nr:probable GPI-anchored adhesin-like protein PGA55 [Centruroides sculpturatus]